MRIGQTSFIAFLSKVVGSAMGFAATLYFARVLGADVLGVFAGVTAVSAWLLVGGQSGIGDAITKRLSEGDDQGRYLLAGIGLLAAYMITVSAIAVVGGDFFDWYLSDFSEYAQYSVVWFIIGILVADSIFQLVVVVLRGEHLAHIAGILKPVRIGFHSIVQIVLVLAGFELFGMLMGYILGGIIISIAGSVFVGTTLAKPRVEQFRSLLSYAKFSWFGGLKTRTLNDVDILVLTALVPSGQVGIYSVAWSLSKFLDLFGSAVSTAVFPEMSEISAAENPDAAADMVNDAIAYGGFIAIPGVVGGTILADRLLRIYGREFTRGATVLWLLLVAVMLYSYLRQFLNTLNAIDRPDKALQVNLLFVTTNVVLNIVLVISYGWVGAAIASVISTGVALVVSAHLLVVLVDFQFPAGEISRQYVAAAGMGVVVLTLRSVVESRNLIQHNFLFVAGLVGVGTAVYLGFLYVLSKRFRQTISRNLPFDLPM